MLNWVEDLRSTLREHGTCVLVTVARARGSTPREAGAKMIVWEKGIAGSVGGGSLEFAAMSRARQMMKDGAVPGIALEEFALGPSLGQCCGGSVSICFEPLRAPAPDWLYALAETIENDGSVAVYTQTGRDREHKRIITRETVRGGDLDPEIERSARSLLQSPSSVCELRKGSPKGAYLIEAFIEADTRLYLFGAGHVGRALVNVLGDLPFHVIWIDPRPSEYPDEIPDNVTPRPVADPVSEADRATPGSLFLVMSHSHQLDLAICDRVLQRKDFRYLGLIGSSTKRERFRRQLLAGGLSQSLVDRLICPIGIEGIPGKQPSEIAIAVAAQLLQTRGRTPIESGLGTAEQAGSGA